MAGEELVRVRTDEIDSVFELSEIFDLHQSLIPATKIGDTEIIAPKSLETLSIDPETGDPLWKPVSLLFRRPFEGEMVKVQLSGNKSLHTTDGHPMLVVENDKLVIREAKSLASGERVPQFSGGLSPSSTSDNIEIDLIHVLPEQELSKLRVRLNNSKWETHSVLLKSSFGWKIKDSIRSNSLPVKDFLAIEQNLGVQRTEITLLAGRGNSHSSFPGVLSITPDFCRFLGYYLSEGCITVEKGKCRIRLTFNRKEAEFIQDVQDIMSALGITSSLYQDKNNQATTIRIGSSLLGSLLKNVLNTGVGSTSMRIPDCVMKSSVQHHEQILAGLLRGDGNVEVFLNKRTYKKNGKTYTHEFNSGMVGYFSSSPKLFAQVEYLLNSMDLSPSRKANSPQLRISGKENLDRMRSFFDGEKAKKLDVLSAARIRHSKQRKTLPWQGGKSVRVENIAISTEKRFVYSLEVPDTHTFATTGGIFVHNCIPIDPFYLTWKAREFGVQTKFIELAGEINTAMPKYVITRLMEALSDAGKPLKHSKVMILGLAYKKNVDDPRESPSFVLWDLLLERGADVCYHDPYIPVAPYMRQHPKYAGINSLPLTPENLAAVDAVLIATSHDGIDYTEVVRHARLVVDTRNACRAVPEELKAGKLIKA
ncbi:MAG TPA: UDP binding domain-containing protein [Acidobacteriota bacterium]|nr:UDP binding domain-containing protein [Acidobacteriota bacterium]